MLAGHGSPAFRVEVLSQIGRALCLQRRFEDALSVLDDAAAQLEGAGLTAAARVMLERGRVHRDRGERAASRDAFDRARDLATRAGEPFLVLDTLHMLALVADGEEALALHREALEIARTSPDSATRRWQCTILENLSAAVCEKGD